MKLPIRKDGENLIISVSSPILFLRVESNWRFGFRGYRAVLLRSPRINIYWSEWGDYDEDF